MTVTSKQEPCLANLVTELANIDGTGNYNLDIDSRVYRQYRHYTEIPEDQFPCCIVIDESDTAFTPMTAGNYSTGTDYGSITNAWPVSIIGYVKLTAFDIDYSGDLQQEVIKMWSDIAIAVLADETRDGNALHTTLLSKSKFVDWQESVGVVVVSFGIKYDFNPTASTPTT